MNEQQKKAVEEAADKARIDNILCLTGNKKKAYIMGAKEIINNPSKYGLQPINEWVSVKDRLPMAWEVGNWDGKRTDEVLIRKTDGKYAVGRMYTGVIDGVEFSDWIEGREEWLINTKDITHWKPINEREEG